LVVNVVVSPVGAMRQASTEPGLRLAAAVLLVAVSLLGSVTLPRQLQLLGRTLAPTGNPARDGHHAALSAGLNRYILFDRLVPPPTILLAAGLVIIAARPMLALAGDRGSRIQPAILLGLVPLLFQRIGEAAVTYVGSRGVTVPGLVIMLPRQFVTGPALLWASAEVPFWIEALSARLNLVSLWSLALWSLALRQLDGQPFCSWHWLLPASCLATAALTTWWLEPMVLTMILGGS
jgi:hypothetical protein